MKGCSNFKEPEAGAHSQKIQMQDNSNIKFRLDRNVGKNVKMMTNLKNPGVVLTATVFVAGQTDAVIFAQKRS